METKENKNTDTDKIKYLASMFKEEHAKDEVGEMAEKLCSDIAKNKISKKEALERYADLEKKYKELGKETPEYIVAIIDELFKTWKEKE